MKSEGMGISLGRLQTIAKDEGTFAGLQKVGATFYTDINRELRRMRSEAHDMAKNDRESEADMLSTKIRRIENLATDIVFRRLKKLGEMAVEASFHGTKPDMAQATPEEKAFFTKTATAIATFKAKGGM